MQANFSFTVYDWHYGVSIPVQSFTITPYFPLVFTVATVDEKWHILAFNNKYSFVLAS